MQLFERFINKVSKQQSGCWEWTASITAQGYGQFQYGKGKNRAHRFSYEYHKGSIPEGYAIDHLCRNRKCVNPDHLEAVTNRENVLRGIGLSAINARKTSCKRGHKLEGNNLIVVQKKNSTTRECRECRNKISARYRNGRGKEWKKKNAEHIREYTKLSMRRRRALQKIKPTWKQYTQVQSLLKDITKEI